MPMLSPALLLWPLLSLSSAAPAVADIDAPVQGSIPAPTDAAVVIGNADYRTLPDVPFAARDARAVQGFLQYTRGIPADRIGLVLDGTRDQMLAGLKAGAAKVKKGGTLWVYFVGQGAVDLAMNDRLLVAVDAADTPKSLARQSVSVTELLTTCHAAGHRTLVILDASFQGVGRDGKEVFSRWRYHAPPLAAYMPQDLMIWTGYAPEQDARSFEAAQHGLFTYLLVGALRGWADGADGRTPDGMVTLEEAQTWLAQSMVVEHGVHPTLERGGSANLWDLSRGAMEQAPKIEIVKTTTPDGQQVSGLSVEAKNDGRNAKSDALMKAIRDRAALDWAQVAQDVAKGGAGAMLALETFIAQYENQTVDVDGRKVVVYVEEVETARSLHERLQERGATP